MHEHKICKLYDFLKSRGLKFRLIEKEQIPLAPSTRLKPGAAVIPGSQSLYNHILFLSEGAKNSLLIIVYSKNTHYPISLRPELESIALALNTEEDIGFWRIETRSDSVFPVFEVNLYTQLQVNNDSFVWKSLGALDRHYLKFLGRFEMFKINPKSAAKVFLQRLGFQRIKEAVVTEGISYIVILSDDDVDESDPLKQFPLRLIVTSTMVTFQIYFSYESAAVTATSAFASSVPYLLAEINNRLAIGYLNFTSASQVQLAVKLPINEATTGNFEGCLRCYYDLSVAGYMQLMRALEALYCSTMVCPGRDESVGKYLALLSEDLQIGEVWQCIDYEQRQSEYLVAANRLRTIEKSDRGARYCLSNFFRENAKDCKIQVKTNREFTAIRKYVKMRNFGYGEISAKLKFLLEEFMEVGVFPTIDMVFCSNSNPVQLFIVPVMEFHSNAEEMSTEFADFILSLLRESEIERNLSLNSLFTVSFTSFEAVKYNSIFGLFSGRLGGNDYFLHPLASTGVAQRTLSHIEMYQSLTRSTNSVVEGLTYLSSEAISEFEIDEELCLCEQSSTSLLHSSRFASMKVDILKALQALHNNGGFHWFLSPVTIRCQGTDGKLVLAMPCAQKSMAEWRLSIVSEKMRKYVAPEVVRFAMGGKEVENAEKADVFSICQILLEHLQHSSGYTNSAFFDLLTLGTSKNPLLRPTLSDLIDAIEMYTF